MKNMILVSVIVPVYQTEHYLKKCLDSIVNQTLKNIEIIIVNDGSPDNSHVIIEKYSKKDARVVVINQENQGLSGARNSGLKIAQGKYISFIDSDDYIELNMLEELVTISEEKRCDIVVTQLKKIYSDNTISVSAFPELISDNFINALNPNFTPSVCSKLFLNELFIKNNILFPHSFEYEDSITTIKLFYFAKKVIYHEPLYYNYCVRDDSITKKLTKKRVENIFYLYKSMEDFFTLEKVSFENNYQLLHVLKLLNSHIFPSLLKDINLDLAYCLLSELKKYKILPSEMEKLSQNFSTHYILFLSNIVQANIKYNSMFSYLLPKNKMLKNQPLEDYLIDYLIEKSIDTIIIYGIGQIYQNILPRLKQNKIQVKYVIDKNLKHNSSIEQITIDELIEQDIRYPIVITSIAFSKDIKKEIETKTRKLNIIDIFKAINNDS